MYDESGQTPEQRTSEALRLLDMLESVDIESLNAEQKRYLLDMRRRRREYGLRIRVTPKQLFWLRDIKDSTL